MQIYFNKNYYLTTWAASMAVDVVVSIFSSFIFQVLMIRETKMAFVCLYHGRIEIANGREQQ